MTKKSGVARLDLAQAHRIAALVQVEIDSFMELASGPVGEGYEEVYKEGYIELLFNGILKMNGHEDPGVKINNAKITPEVVHWYKEASQALKEEEALREKYMKVLSGENLKEH